MPQFRDNREDVLVPTTGTLDHRYIFNVWATKKFRWTFHFLSEKKNPNARKIARIAWILTIFGPKKSQRRDLFLKDRTNKTNEKISKKTFEEKFETNKKGIFAVGDICSYPGKLKLILSGFHEVALASVECFKRARPNEKYRFEFTTASKTIQKRLGKND